MSQQSPRNNGLYFIVGALVVAVLGMGYLMLQDTQSDPRLEISISEDGLNIDEK